MKVSQTFMCICIVLFCFSGISAQITSDTVSSGDVLVESKDLKVSLVSDKHEHMFLSAKFEGDGENLVINTFDNIRSILFYNKDNELEIVVPVGADNVIIGRDMFGNEEDYRIEFQFENTSEMVSATLAMK